MRPPARPRAQVPRSANGDCQKAKEEPILVAPTMAAATLLLACPEAATAAARRSSPEYYAYRETTPDAPKLFVDYGNGNYRCPNLPSPASEVELYRRYLESPWITPGDFGVWSKLFGQESPYATGRVTDINQRDCKYYVQVDSGPRNQVGTSLEVKPRGNPWLESDEGQAVSAVGVILFLAVFFQVLSGLPKLLNND